MKLLRIKKVLRILTFFTLIVAPLRPCYAIFALETTMQLMIGPELTGIKGAVAGVAPAIVKANVAIGKSIIAAMHELTVNQGLATAAMQTTQEFGPQSVIPVLCENSAFAGSLYKGTAKTGNLSFSTSKWFEEQVSNKFTNRSTSNFFTHSAIKKVTPDRETLLPQTDVYTEEDWGKTASFNMFMLTPEVPTKLTDAEVNTQAGQQYDAYKKLYEGKLTYVNAAFNDDSAQLSGTIELDTWLNNKGSIVPKSMIDAMKRDKRNMVLDSKKGKWMMSKKSALTVLSEARINNDIWWENVSQVKSVAWVTREQTILAALQLEATIRTLDKLDHLVRLASLSTHETSVEPMRSRLNKLGKTAKSQSQRDGR